MIGENLLKIKKMIADAAGRSGRDPSEIKLLAVSKHIDIPEIKEAYANGQLLFGENYAQEAREKIEQLDKAISWHFIGHLQSNKAKLAARIFQMIETVDNLKIARILNTHAREIDKTLEILVQINIGRESQKSGVYPLDAGQFLKDLGGLEHLRVRGLMAMPPFTEDPEETRPYFRTLKNMADRFQEEGLFADNAPAVLSMGMSGDFEVAVEEGSTLVRVGTAIFGSRT
ncbi:MAG: YggS family pyridoxal phosphate-dependent enzyme [Desulfobulbaceae bacterium]|nr:YggS family pyridoxal phosphate-dependent enzyme [Desulfobulbaceae bacterium]